MGTGSGTDFPFVSSVPGRSLCGRRPVPTLPGIETIDSLSAGDVFHGVFALELAAVRDTDAIADADVFAAARTASAAAALKCAVFGGRLGTPLRAATDAALSGWQPEMAKLVW